MHLKHKSTTKSLSVVLALLMVISIFATAVIPGSAATIDTAVAAADTTQDVAASYNLAENVQDGQILQCWNWSFKNIENNLEKIAAQGFSAIQTSPIQPLKEGTSGKSFTGWWVVYQPTYFKINTRTDNAMGTKTDFESMCKKANALGVKVIVDVVLNHTANHQSGNTISPEVDPDFRNNPSCWHDISKNSEYKNRTDITQWCMDGVPDLNTSNSVVKNKAKDFLIECIDAGAYGFRFDGAKHIETPVDNVSSDFWPTILGEATKHAQSKYGFTPYYYGEILNEVTGSNDKGDATKILNFYTSYMSVTANGVSNNIRNSVNGGNAEGAKRADFTFSDGSQPDGNKAVLWNESHDTYAHNESNNISNTVINKTWALVGTRSKAAGMYFARPESMGQQQGTASLTAWSSKEVAEINKFNNAMIGKGEYLHYSNSIAYNVRGTGGAVLVNCGGTNATVSVPANGMASGTYKDQISGNSFSVSGNTISGQIGSTGIAVIYNAVTGPSASITPGSTSYKTDSLSLTLNYSSESTSGQYSIDGGSYTSFTSGQKITIGAGLAFGTKTTVSVKASNSSATSEPVTYTYTKVDPNAVTTLYFDNSSYKWKTVYAYIYDESVTPTLKNALWPGVQMTLDSATGYYTIDVPENLLNGRVIFTEGENATTNRYPADGESGLTIGGESHLFSAGNKWTVYTPTVTTTIPPVTTTAPIITTTPITTTTPIVIVKVLRGDANGDGKVDLGDALIMQKHVARLVKITGNNFYAADINNDGIVDTIDILALQQYLAEFANTFNVDTYFNIEGGTPVTTKSGTTAAPIATTLPVATTTAPITTTAPADGTKTVYVGVINYVMQNKAMGSAPRMHYWGGSGGNGNAVATDTGKTVSAACGSSYWNNAAQTFQVFAVKIPSDATSMKFRHQTDDSAWFGDNITIGSNSNTCYLIFEWSDTYHNITTTYTP